MSVTVTRTSLFAQNGDVDGDGRIDPGDTLITHIRLTNTNGTPITAANILDTLNGVSNIGNITVTPIANDDNIGTITGNTPYAFDKSAILTNDVDYDDNTPTFTIQVGPAVHGSVAFDGTTFTFTPETGYVGAASFTYFITDESGLQSISSGTVNVTIQGLIWYVDSAAAPGGDGSYGHSFTDFSQLNSANGIGDKDGAGDTIFVKQNALGYTANLVLETGETLTGDGQALNVNGNTISTGAGTTTLANSTGNIVQLSTDNTVKGFTITTAGTAVGMVDNGSVSSTTGSQGLVLDKISFSGVGQAVDIDAGGKITATIASLSSGGGAQGMQLAGTASSGTGLLTGNVTISNGLIQTSTGQGVLIGQAGGGTAGSGGDINVTATLDITNPTGSAVEIQDRTGGTVTLTGTITDGVASTNAAILLDQNAGTINFNGQVFLNNSGLSGGGVAITNNSAAVNFTTASNGLDISTANGAGFVASGGGTLTLSGSGNTISTTTGQLLSLDGVGMAASNVNFASMASSATVAGAHAVYLNNLSNGTFSGGNVTVAGTSGNGAGAQAADGVHIDGGSSATMNFGTVTVTNSNGDGIDVNGAGNGNVTIASVDLDGMGGNGIVITNATGSVTVSGGSIGTGGVAGAGAANDAALDDVHIAGGTGAVTIAAAITKTTAGDAVDISGHNTGAIGFSGAINTSATATNAVLMAGQLGGATTFSGGVTSTGGSVANIGTHAGGSTTFSGALNATGANTGINLVNNSGGTIGFTNSAVNLNTSTGIAFNDTNTLSTGAVVSFTGGNLNIDTTSGIGINATSTTTGAGHLLISGASNVIDSGTGQAIKISGVTSDGITFLHVNDGNVASANAISLINAGSGGFTLTGTGTTAGSGGTFAGATGADLNTAQGIGIFIQNTDNISLSNLNFTGTYQNWGIYGINVNNFLLQDSNMSGVYGTDNTGTNLEGNIRFSDLTGAGTFKGNNIAGAYNDNIYIENFENNTLNLTFKDTAANQAVFNGNAVATGNNAITVITHNDGNLNMLVDSVAFNSHRVTGVVTRALDTSNHELTIQNSTFNNTHSNIISTGGGAIDIGGTGNGASWGVDYSIINNTATGAKGGPVIAAQFVGTSGTARGFVSGNTIGTPGAGNNGPSDNSGVSGNGLGMSFSAEQDAGVTGNNILSNQVTIQNNVIADINGNAGIRIRAARGTSTTAHANVEATLTGNTVKEMGSGFVYAALYTLVGAAATDFSTMGLDIRNNTFSVNGSTVAPGSAYGAVFADQVDGNAGHAFYYLPGYNLTQGEDYFGNGGKDYGTYLQGRGNVLLNTSSPITGDPTYLTWAQHARFANTPAMQPAQTGSNTQLPPAAAQVFVPQVVAQDLEEKPVSDPQVDTSADVASGTTTDGTTASTDQGSAPAPVPADPVSPASGPIVDDGVLSQSELNFIVDAAIKRWEAAGASPDQLAAMRAASVSVADMTGVFAASSDGHSITVDSDGAGYGWFLDATPGDDAEYHGSGTRLTATDGAAYNHLDLLTVVMHELGHQAGLDDIYNANNAADLMYGYTNPSERRLPAQGEAASGVPGAVGHTAFALTPIYTIPTLNPGKIVEVSYTSTVNAFAAGIINPVVNTATVNYSDPNPQSVTGTETWNTTNSTLLIDSFTIGDVVFKDLNHNGAFDAGEGVVGVKLNLYVDTNGDNVLDANDQSVTSVNSGAGGAYAFTGLAAGSYIVQIDATNFGSGKPLEGLLNVKGGTDPDNDINNDDNGLTAYNSTIASQAITLTSAGEPTNDGDADNDTNLTLDFGFYQNQAPDAVNDSVSVAEDSGANDLTATLLSNDTDPDADTRTITSATQGTHGTVSVVAGVLTYTPTGNYNGTDSFTYTISDGNGGTDTATASVTVTAVNDPVTAAAPPSATLNEDATNVAISGLSISDVDAALAPAGVYEVTLASTHGTMTLTTLTGLTFSGGSDGTADASMTFHGTLSDINTALATAKYTPAGNYNGAAQIQIDVTDSYNNIVATGSGSATNNTASVAVTVNSVNDEPVGADNAGNASEGSSYTFHAADFATGMTDPNDNPANSFAGVKITQLPGAAAGVIKLNGIAIGVNAVITLTQLNNNELTFDPAAGSTGTTPTFKYEVQDNGTTANGGVEFDQSPNTFTFTIGSPNAAPVLDLDGDDSNSVGTGFSSAYTEGGAAAAISDTDVTITDADAGDDVRSATITITNAVTGDTLDVGSLPAGITLDPSSTATMVKLVGIAGTTAADFQTAIGAVTFSSTSDDPTNHGSNLSRSITVVVNDGTSNSNVATASVAVTDVNDAPSGASSTITAVEDTYRILSGTDFGFTDVDGTLGTVTISAVTGGKIYYDADGAGGADPVEATLPHTYTAADVTNGLVSFKADPNTNGPGIGSISFTLTDDDAAAAPSSYTLTVDVTAVDDPAVAVDDAVTTDENLVLNGNVFNANPTTPDSDPDGPPLQVSKVNGVAMDVGQTITLASGAKLKLNSDGTFSYDPNGAFNYLTHTGNAGEETGAANTSALDSFKYTLANGNEATVTVTVNGIATSDDLLYGTSGNDVIVGTEGGDFFRLEQGGNDTATGLGGGDAFYFGNTLTAADSVDGGGGRDVVAIQGGAYAGGYTLGAGNLVNVETLSILTGADTRFGDLANNLYDYNITTIDANVAAGTQLIVNASTLQVGEDLTFNGSAETDGNFFIYAGKGTDNLTGGAGADVFFFADGRFGASDQVNGGGGNDIVVLRGPNGMTSVTFGATQLTSVETVTLMSAADTRFYSGGDRYDYSITTNNGNVAAGATMTFNAGGLQSDEQFTFNGAAETDGHFRIFGGAGVDDIHGGQNDDLIFGGGSADNIYGGGGNDVFRYQDTTDSNSFGNGQDGIQDFNLGDKIDLSRIDANVNLAGDQAFNIIGNAAFQNAGDLRVFDQGGGIWLIQGDVDGDHQADFTLSVVVIDNNVHPLTGADFML